MNMLALLRIPNVRLLVIAQALGMSASSFGALLGGIIGTRIAPDPRYATLPAALAIVGIALASVPVALMMRRLGRRAGFSIAAAVATAGALLAAIAVQQENFWLFSASSLLVGVNLAATQQYRFAVTENVRVEDMPRAVSLVLMGTLAAALLGPFLANNATAAAGLSRDAAAYISLAAVQGIAMLMLLKYRDVKEVEAAVKKTGRPFRAIVGDRGFVIAAAAAAVGFGVMTFLMTATPIAMHVMDGHALTHTATVIQLHIAAMYLPSLFSGALIRRFGELWMIRAGIAITLGCIALAFTGRGVMHYALALILLGLGWNFLFVAGTTLLARTHRPEERFRAQAANEFVVFATSAAASLAAGFVVHASGWEFMLLLSVAPLVLLLMLTLFNRRYLFETSH